MNFDAELSKREQIFLSLFIVLKLALIFAIPFTGDEVYFTTWAANPALGYYDHPPMVGWGMHLLGLISDHYFFYRFFSFATSIVVAYVVFRLANEFTDEKSALYVAIVFFISPISIMMSLISNDIFLLFFGSLGAFSFYHAIKRDSAPYAILAGILLGLAFLSKYFAVFLIFGLLLFALNRKDRVGIRAATITSLVASLFVLENFYYNYNNCWNNILFNFQSRVSDNGFTLFHPSVFIATLLLLIPPYGIFLLFKSRLNESIRENSNVLRFSLFAITPALLVFLYVSLKNQIGLHWLLLFIPFAYILFASLDVKKLKALYSYNFVISMLTGIGILAVTQFHQPLLGDKNNYYQISLFTQTESICKQLPTGQNIYTLNYTNNSMLSYFCEGNQYHVLFDVSKYGREDDKHIDISSLNNGTLTLFAMHKKELKKMASYFDTIKHKQIQIENNPNYYLVTGTNFNFQKYKEEILSIIAERYYNIPDWLPAGQCSFKEKYSL